MRRFLEHEKTRQTKLKTDPGLFSQAAIEDGYYKGKPRPFCLPLEHAEENLYPGIRHGQ